MQHSILSGDGDFVNSDTMSCKVFVSWKAFEFSLSSCFQFRLKTEKFPSSVSLADMVYLKFLK